VKRLLAASLLLLLFPLFAFAQTPTIVTGTVTDINGLPYSNASVSAQLIPSTASPTIIVNGIPTQIQGQQNASADVNGNFSMSLFCNSAGGGCSVISPSGTQWQITVNENGTPPPLGTGPQACTATVTITGASQSVSSSFGGCPGLSNGSGGISPNSPIPRAQEGVGFNVLNYMPAGKGGDARVCNSVSSTGGGSSILTGTCNWTSADLTLQIVLNAGDGSFTTWSSSTTISSLNSGSSINVSQPNNGGAFTGVAVFGTLEDSAVQTALGLANAQLLGTTGTGNTARISSPCRIHFPGGGHLLGNLAIAALTLATGNGCTISGDGPDVTFLYTAGAANGFAGTQSLITVPGSTNSILIIDLTIDGANNVTNAPAVLIQGQARMKDVTIQRWGIFANSSSPAWGLQAFGGIWTEKVVVLNNGGGINCQQCNGEFHDTTSSNNGGGVATATNLLIQNVSGLQNGLGLRIWGGLWDECGSNPNGCARAVNSHDVWSIGVAWFSTNSGIAFNVDPNSVVHMNGGIAGVFGNDSNANGVRVQAGGMLQASDIRFVSTGTGKALNNLGFFRNEGGNSYENMFVIASGTSTGTTVVLTLTNVGAAVNAVCAVGDGYIVQNASIAGYDGYSPPNGTVGGSGAGNQVVTGLTAVTATTATYTSIGSNMGAAGASGVFFCRNQTSYSGTLPITNQTNAANTWVMVPAFATGVTFGNQILRQSIAVTDITVVSQSNTNTTCATAPVFTLTDGTNTVTITLTSGKTSWTTAGAAPDVHTGLGQTYKAGSTITGSFTLGTCATPPVNPSVTYSWYSTGDN
jgi:hypothetical protein